VSVAPLPALTVQVAAERAIRLAATVRRTSDGTLTADDRPATQREVLDALAWLSDTVTEPNLAALGHAAIPTAQWPRAVVPGRRDGDAHPARCWASR
jgi:hypothetical protein